MGEQKQQLLLIIDEVERKRDLLLTLQASINFNYKQLKRALAGLPQGYSVVAKKWRYGHRVRTYILEGPTYNCEMGSFPFYASDPVEHLKEFIKGELLMCEAVLEMNRKHLQQCQTL